MRSAREQHMRSLPVPTVRVRSHSLQADYGTPKSLQRKTSADIPRLRLSVGDNKPASASKTSSSSWFHRRFSWFSIDQPGSSPPQQQPAAARFSIYNDESYAILLGPRRPSVIMQMMGVHAQRRKLSNEVVVEYDPHCLFLFSHSFGGCPRGRRRATRARVSANASAKKVSDCAPSPAYTLALSPQTNQ